MAGALYRPGTPYRSGSALLRALAGMAREAPPLGPYRAIRYCDRAEDVLGLPEEVEQIGKRAGCTSCALLACYLAAWAIQQGHAADLCCSVSGPGVDVEHAWTRINGILRDPSEEGGLVVPARIRIGAVIVPV